MTRAGFSAPDNKVVGALLFNHIDTRVDDEEEEEDEGQDTGILEDPIFNVEGLKYLG